MQHEFHFVFPYPAGCLHVPERGSEGHAIDGCARVCGRECADVWARSRGRILTGEHRLLPGDGTIAFRSFTTMHPEEMIRPSFAHLATITRG